MVGVARKWTGGIRQALKEGSQGVLGRRMPQARGLYTMCSRNREQLWWLGEWRVWGKLLSPLLVGAGSGLLCTGEQQTGESLSNLLSLSSV